MATRREPYRHFYAGLGLDRVSLLRRDSGWIAARLADPASVLLPVWRAQNLVRSGEVPAAARLTVASAAGLVALAREVVLLGLDGETACFAIELSHIEAPEALPPLVGAGRFADLRSVGPLLSGPEGALLAYARGVTHWHRRHRFCGVCGSPTASVDAGHVRRCTNPDCATDHFPRTDPAVIMAVTAGDRLLLGRQASWPPGMYSVLAGFVEPGETLEEAVAREVMEEVGIPVTDVSYHSSQPWPFPSSIMLGFNARATRTELRLDRSEIDDAHWFTRAELRASPEDERFRMPRRDSISRQLIEDWIAEGA
ncbi:MAG: NAD(+) diphosphatase [Dongiaceae bacterium]